MKRLLVALALLFACNSQYELEPNQVYIRNGINRAVEVTSVDFVDVISCSGVILSTERVLTAAHCIHKSGLYFTDVKVNGKQAFVLIKDDKSDLALLMVHTMSFSPLVINEHPHVAEKVFTVSDPGGLRVVSIGRILRLDPGRMILNTVVAWGSSGGAVYDTHGRLVGISNELMEAKGAIIFGSAIDGQTIRRFLQQ